MLRGEDGLRQRQLARMVSPASSSLTDVIMVDPVRLNLSKVINILHVVVVLKKVKFNVAFHDVVLVIIWYR